MGVAFFAVLLGGGWLLLFSYRQVDYSHQLWFDFSPDGDVSRALRALGSVIGVAAAAGVAYLLLVVVGVLNCQMRLS